MESANGGGEGGAWGRENIQRSTSNSYFCSGLLQLVM